MSTRSASAPAALPIAAGSRAQRTARRLASPSGAVFLLLLALIIAITAFNPSFAEPGQLIRFVARVAPIAIAAMGQYFVLICGEFDLSMGALVTAQVVISGTLIGQDGTRILPVLVLMFAFAILVGLINGLVTNLLRVPSFIATLGMMLVLSGLVFYSTGGSAGENPVDAFRQIGRGGVQGVPVLTILPYSVLVLAVVLLLSVWLMSRPFGKTLIAVGDNATAARLTGVPVWWVRTRAFILSAIAATISGILLVGYAGVNPSVGRGYEFAAITGAVVGGVVLGGGRGWIVSAAAGAVTLEALFTLLNFSGVPATFRDSVQGLIIIVAVAFSAQTWQRRRRSSEPHAPAAAPTLSSRSTTAPTPGTD